jgi:hypothetical protein
VKQAKVLSTNEKQHLFTCWKVFLRRHMKITAAEKAMILKRRIAGDKESEFLKIIKSGKPYISFEVGCKIRMDS